MIYYYALKGYKPPGLCYFPYKKAALAHTCTILHSVCSKCIEQVS